MPSDVLRKLKPIKSKTDIHSITECPQQVNKKYLHHRPIDVYEGKETIYVIDNDGNKKFIVPRTEPTEPPLIWSESQLKRLEKIAQRMTQAEKNRLQMQIQEQQLKLKNESNERTKLLSNAKLAQSTKPGTKLYGEEAEAANRNQYILQRAFELRQEQEDEVKHANSIILAAKCLSIRQAQILEKKLIDKELKEQELKLDIMMEEERLKALQEEEDRKQKRRQLNFRHVTAVSQQIRDNDVRRDLEFEHKQEESRNISRAAIAMQRDELKKIQEKRLEQQKAREDFCKANEAIAHLKIVQNEEERVANFKIQEFMRKKAEREAAYDIEMERIKLEKNLEIARIQAEQERSMDVQAANDEIRAQRIQEEYERAWREREKANVLKRKTDLENLLKAREKQLEDIRKSQALEIERDRQEFHRVAKVERELYEIELEKQRRKKQGAMKHCKSLMQQINEKELKRLELQRLKFEEAHALLMQKELRDLNVQKVLKQKVKRLRENKVPDQVVGDIQRQLKLME